jgi:hypothetical protein
MCFVGAGLVLVVRAAPLLLLAPEALTLLGWAGALSAIFAALLALAGRDIVRIDVHLLCGFGALSAVSASGADIGPLAFGAVLVILACVPLCTTSVREAPAHAHHAPLDHRGALLSAVCGLRGRRAVDPGDARVAVGGRARVARRRRRAPAAGARRVPAAPPRVFRQGAEGSAREAAGGVAPGASTTSS